jgi:hypothetical protein
MSGVSRQKRNLGDFGPSHSVAVAEGRVGGDEKAISLAVKRHLRDAADRLVIEIGDAGIGLEVVQ